MSRPEQPSGAAMRRSLLLRLLGSGVILAVLLVVLPFGDLWAALGRIPLGFWLLALGSYLTLHVIGVAKWRLMVNAAHGGFRFLDALRCYYFGLFGNTFLPSLVGGDAVRAGLAFRLADSKAGVVFGSLLDRILDVLGLATIAGIGALVIPGVLDPQNRIVFWILAGGLVAGGLIGALLVLLLPARRFPFRVRRILAKLRRSWRGLIARPGTVVVALGMGLVLQSALVLLQAALGRAVGIEVSLQTWFFAWPMAKISALVPVTQGGIGIREAALAGLLAPFGVAPVLAFAAGLVFQSVVISGGLLGGLIAFTIGRVRPDTRKRSKLPSLSRA